MYKGIEICVTGASALFFTLLVFIISTDQLGAQEQKAQVGVAVRSSSLARFVEFETSIGRDVDVARHFALWDDEFPSADETVLLSGRDMILSVKPVRDGEPILWADIAAAQPGDPLYQDMVDWANAIRPYESQIWLTFHHEPEARANIPYGDADEFIAAWRNFMTVIDSEGLELAGRVWIMTDYAFHLTEIDRRHANFWYPGDEWVEAIAADAYNWHHCRTGIDTRWMTPRSIIEPIRDFGLKHPTEQMMITELGSAEDPTDSTRKGEWIADVQNLFKDPTYSQFTLVAYFNLHHDKGIFDCDWRISTSTAATDAFAALADDPFYGGTGIATPFVPPVLDACMAVRDGDTVTLNWNFDGHIIRRNGDWLSTEPDGTTSFTDINAPANATYVIRDIQTGSPVDVVCEDEPTAAEAAAISAAEAAEAAAAEAVAAAQAAEAAAAEAVAATEVTEITAAAEVAAAEAEAAAVAAEIAAAEAVAAAQAAETAATTVAAEAAETAEAAAVTAAEAAEAAAAAAAEAAAEAAEAAAAEAAAISAAEAAELAAAEAVAAAQAAEAAAAEAVAATEVTEITAAAEVAATEAEAAAVAAELAAAEAVAAAEAAQTAATTVAAEAAEAAAVSAELAAVAAAEATAAAAEVPEPPVPGEMSCSVAVNDNNVPVLSYSGFTDVSNVQFRRNNGWIGTGLPGAGTYEDTSAVPGVPNSYVVRSRPGGVVTDLACSPETITIVE